MDEARKMLAVLGMLLLSCRQEPLPITTTDATAATVDALTDQGPCPTSQPMHGYGCTDTTLACRYGDTTCYCWNLLNTYRIWSCVPAGCPHPDLARGSCSTEDFCHYRFEHACWCRTRCSMKVWDCIIGVPNGPGPDMCPARDM